MDILIMPIISVLIIVLQLYSYAIIIYVILGWLEHFNVLNRYNHFVYTLHTFFFRIVEPAVSKIRMFMPALGGVDISPFILLLILYALEIMLGRIALHFPH